EPLERLIERREEVFAGATKPVRTIPHVPSSLRGEDQFVPERGKVLLEDPTEVLFCTASGRPIVIGKIEVEHPKIKGAADNVALCLERAIIAEIVPETECDSGEL